MSNQQSSSHRRKKKQSSNNRTRPNYFVAVPLAHHDALTTHICKVQDEIVKAQPDMEGAFVDPASAHITLCVLTLKKSEENEEDSQVPSVEDGVRCLEACAGILKNQSLHRPFNLSFKGLGTFNDKVLFLDVEEGDGKHSLDRLAESVAEHFFTQGVLKELPREFNAHLTVAKTSNLFSRRGPKPRNRNVRILAGSYAAYKDASVEGEFVIDEIQLCQMQGRTHGSYYTVAATIPLKD